MSEAQMGATGLRLKFNRVLVPLVALGIAGMVWADYRHEYGTLMEAHAQHVVPVGTEAAAGPMDPWTLPEAAARRSLRLHILYGGALLVLLILAVNLALQWLVLCPIASMRQRLTYLQRGRWRDPVGSAGGDEIGLLHGGVQRLGFEIDALVGQILETDRLAVLALVGKRLEASIDPEVRRIGEIAARLAAGDSAAAQRDGEVLGHAAAAILAAVHEYDGVFVRRPAGRRQPRRESKSVRGAA